MRAAAVARDVSALRATIERVQGRRLGAPSLPTHPAFDGLLPGGGLKPGAVYALAPSAALLLALLSRPSRDGVWCAAVGMPDLGAEAAEHYGVALDRFVLIPDPGPRWLAVTATIAEVLPVIAVRPPGRVGDAEAARVAARLRDRGTVLLVQGRWPQAEAVIDVVDARWSGLGDGHGYLSGREVTVAVASRRAPGVKRARMLLPAADGTVTPLVRTVGRAAVDGPSGFRPTAVPAPIRAAG